MVRATSRNCCAGSASTWPAWLGIDYRTASQAAAECAGRRRRPGDLGAQHRPRRAGASPTAPTLVGVPVIFNLPAFLIVMLHHRGCSCAASARAPGFNTRDGRAQARDHRVLPRRRRVLRQAGELDARSRPTAWRASAGAAAIIFFAYIGFDAVSTAAEETKNPQRDMPIGMIAQPGHLHADLHRASRSCSPGMLALARSSAPPNRSPPRSPRWACTGPPASSRSAPSSPRRRCSSCSSSASRASSSRWRATGCCRSGPRRCTRSTGRRTSPRS